MQNETTHCRYAEDVNPAFPAEILAKPGGEALRDCIQCGTCSATCPMSVYMDLTPRRVIALTRAGLERDVLQSATPWLCASCYECQVRCPREIKVTDIIYALKRRAIEEQVYPKKFPIPILAREFGKMIRGKGRITETRLVMNLYMKTNILKATKMARMGLGLMRTGRFSLKSESVKNRGQIQTIMKSLEERKEGAA